MKKFLIAFLFISLGSQAWSGVEWKDSLSSNRRLVLKSSCLTLFNWRSPEAFADIGVETTIYGPVTLDADIGVFYRSPFATTGESTSGYFTNAGIRYYMNEARLPYYLGISYRYQHKRQAVELDFTEAGLPYRKIIDADRHSSFFFVLAGMSRNFLFERFYFDYFFGLGLEHRVGRLTGLTGFEQDAVDTGLVDEVKNDEFHGKVIPAWTFGVKAGFRIF